MSLRERFRRWQVRRRRKRAARRHEASALREFVYLDEVSVFSLISSRLGPVATEFTATESSSLTGELTGTAGVSAGVLKSELKARSEATQTHGTQVLRKATVQATFKELYEYVEDGFVLRPAETQPPDVRSARDLETALEYSRAGGWVTRASELTRGQLSLDPPADSGARFRPDSCSRSFSGVKPGVGILPLACSAACPGFLARGRVRGGRRGP